MLHECERCHKKAQNLKRCAACSMVWYCNSECQKSHWPIHLVSCNLGRPVTTAERLVACVHGRTIPELDTRRDYGFTYTPSHDDTIMRLKVYTILIIDLQVKAKTIQRWVEEGNLDSMMLETFNDRLSPAQRQQEPYLWFRSHQPEFNRVSNLLPHDMDIANIFWKAWAFICGSPSISNQNLLSFFGNITNDQIAKNLFPLYHLSAQS